MDTPPPERSLPGRLPPARWGMVALCFAATAINYLDRANLSLAVPFIQKEFNFSSTQMGLVLSAFFWTYALMQLPSGWLIDRIGPKIIYSIAVGWWSLFTLATGMCRSLAALMGCRLLLGAGEAAAYPCNTKVTALWFPQGERGFASSLFDSGSRVGAALSWPVVGYLISTLGWRKSFLITGTIGFVWIVVWALCYRNPNPAERAVISPPETVTPAAAKAAHVRWLDLFRYRTVWGMMIGFFCLNFVIYFFITWFPSYLVKARGFSMLQVGTIGAIPAICAIAGGWIGGFSSDALYRRGWSLTAARKTCLVGGMLLSSSIALAALVESQALAVALFCLSYASLAFTGANIWCLPADVAPTSGHVGSLAGIQNFAASLAGAATTTFTGYLVSLTNGSFLIPLMVGGGVCVAGAFAYLVVVGKIERLPPLAEAA